MKIRIAVLLSLAVFAGGANAQDRWRYAGASDDFTVYLDTTTMSRTGDRVEVWGEYRYESSKEFSRVASLHRIDCVRRTSTNLSRVEYGPDRKVKDSHASAGYPQPIVPGTVGELEWGAACPTEAQPLGIEQVRALGDKLRSSDPNFEKKIAEMRPAIEQIQATVPPTLWAEALEFEWNRLK